MTTGPVTLRRGNPHVHNSKIWLGIHLNSQRDRTRHSLSFLQAKGHSDRSVKRFFSGTRITSSQQETVHRRFFGEARAYGNSPLFGFLACMILASLTGTFRPALFTAGDSRFPASMELSFLRFRMGKYCLWKHTRADPPGILFCSLTLYRGRHSHRVWPKYDVFSSKTVPLTFPSPGFISSRHSGLHQRHTIQIVKGRGRRERLLDSVVSKTRRKESYNTAPQGNGWTNDTTYGTGYGIENHAESTRDACWLDLGMIAEMTRVEKKSLGRSVVERRDRELRVARKE